MTSAESPPGASHAGGIGRKATRRQVSRRAVVAGACGLLGAVLAGCGRGPGAPGPATPTTPTPTDPVVPEAGGDSPVSTGAAHELPEPTPEKLPRWRGFNLQQKFHQEWGNRRFEERDFAWIAELGFNFVRLPMDYRLWTAHADWRSLREEVLVEIDEAVRWGERYGLHVCLNFHRAPGWSVARPAEPLSLWVDEEAQEACAGHWELFAERYAGVPNRQLSFNLFNEPPALEPAVHRRVVERVVEAIRRQDGTRLLLCDGRDTGKQPPTELLGLGVAATTRGYDPLALTHYGADWIEGADRWDRPTYPLVEGDTVWDREALRRRLEPWQRLEALGMGVMVGEFGAYNQTPHVVVLAWMRDCLELWREAGWGWALWNFREAFGPLDSRRADIAYAPFRGHRLDRGMLELLLTSGA